VVEKMRDRGISQLPVTSGGVLVGMVTEADLMNFLGSGEGAPDALVAKCMTRHVASVNMATPLSALEELLTRSPAAVVVDDSRHPVGILARIDLLHHLARARATA
jgi:cystathionine beta-synthase